MGRFTAIVDRLLAEDEDEFGISPPVLSEPLKLPGRPKGRFTDLVDSLLAEESTPAPAYNVWMPSAASRTYEPPLVADSLSLDVDYSRRERPPAGPYVTPATTALEQPVARRPVPAPTPTPQIAIPETTRRLPEQEMPEAGAFAAVSPPREYEPRFKAPPGAAGTVGEQFGAFAEKWMENPSRSVPFVSGAMDLADMANLLGAAQRARAGGATEEDLNMLQDWADAQAQEKGTVYQILDTVAAMPAFMGELAVTAGISTAARKGAEKVALRYLKSFVGRDVRQTIGQRAASTAVRAATISAGEVARAPVARASEIAAGTVRELLPIKVQRAADDQAIYEIAKEDPAFEKAMARAFGDEVIEVWSERTGGAFTVLGRGAFSRLSKVGLIRAIAKANPGRKPEQILALTRRVGYDGILQEMAEERVGEAARAVTGIAEEWKLPTAEQLLIELGAFAVPGAAFTAVSATLNRRQRRPAEGAPEAPPGTTETVPRPSRRIEEPELAPTGPPGVTETAQAVPEADIQVLQAQLEAGGIAPARASEMARMARRSPRVYESLKAAADRRPVRQEAQEGAEASPRASGEPAVPHEPTVQPAERPVEPAPAPDDFDRTYPVAGEIADGRRVRSHVPNFSSIEASISDPEVLRGIRDVPMSAFTLDEEPTPTDAASRELAEEIRQSGEISPLIVGIDEKGPYIIEGAHRYDALKVLGAESFPAVVVLEPNARRLVEPPPVASTLERPVAREVTPRALEAEVAPPTSEEQAAIERMPESPGRGAIEAEREVAPPAPSVRLRGEARREGETELGGAPPEATAPRGTEGARRRASIPPKMTPYAAIRRLGGLDPRTIERIKTDLPKEGGKAGAMLRRRLKDLGGGRGDFETMLSDTGQELLTVFEQAGIRSHDDLVNAIRTGKAFEAQPTRLGEEAVVRPGIESEEDFAEDLLGRIRSASRPIEVVRLAQELEASHDQFRSYADYQLAQQELERKAQALEEDVPFEERAPYEAPAGFRNEIARLRAESESSQENVRRALSPTGGAVQVGQDVRYVVSRNTDKGSVDEYPWRVTTFVPDESPGQWIAAGHTVHQELDDPQSTGVYPRGAVQEVANAARSYDNEAVAVVFEPPADYEAPLLPGEKRELPRGQKRTTGGKRLEGTPLFEALEEKKAETERAAAPQGDLFGGAPKEDRPQPPAQGDLFGGVAEAGAEYSNPRTVEAARKAWQEQGTESPWFRRWFGDSKVVDEGGKPLTMYHGTPDASFDVFADNNPHFTHDPLYASRYAKPGASSTGVSKESSAPAVYPVYLAIQRPFDSRNPRHRRIYETEYLGKWSASTAPLSDKGLPDWTESTNLAEWIQENDLPYDGFVVDEMGDEAGDRGIAWVPMRPEQIKSTGNRGTFSSEDPSIVREEQAEYGEPPQYKVQPPRKLYRGISEGGGMGTFAMGKGAYSTPDRQTAGYYGEVQEVPADRWWPRNPLVLHGQGSGSQLFRDHVLRNSDFRNIREFNAAYPDPGAWVREQGYDGVVAGDEVVYYQPGMMEDEGGGVGEVSPVYHEPAPTFYSAALRAAENLKQSKGTAQQMYAQIAKTPGVKQDELSWLGLREWLTAKEGPVTKDEIVDFIRANEVRVEEVEKGEKSGTREAADLADELDTLDISDDLDADEYPDWPDFASDIEDLAKDAAAAIRLGDYSKAVASLEEASRLEGEFGDDPDIRPFLERAQNLDQDALGTKFSSYVLPGAKPGTYRELLLTLPSEEPMPPASYRPSWQLFDGGEAVAQGDDIAAQRWRDADPDADVRPWQTETLESRRRAPEGTYRGPHWDEPNVLAHVRFNDRTDSEGRKVLFVEEVQSDWHQAGRKRGYGGGEYDKYNQQAKDLLNEEGMSIAPQNLRWLLLYPRMGRNSERIAALSEAFGPDWIGAASASLEKQAGVPDAPFKSTWHELALKRLLRYASENDYQVLAWTPGDVQANRYDLSKKIGALIYVPGEARFPSGDVDLPARPGRLIGYPIGDWTYAVIDEIVSEEQLPDHVGKEVAERLLAAPLERKSGDVGPVRRLYPKDLKLGGEGMKGFYDVMLPRFLNKYAKKWGASVGTTEIPSLEAPRRYQGPEVSAMELREKLESSGDEMGVQVERQMRDMLTRMDDSNWTFKEAVETHGSEFVAGMFGGSLQDVGMTVHAIPITDAMRQSVMQEGQAVFERARAYGSEETLRATAEDKDAVGSVTERLADKPFFSVDEDGGFAWVVTPSVSPVFDGWQATWFYRSGDSWVPGGHYMEDTPRAALESMGIGAAQRAQPLTPSSTIFEASRSYRDQLDLFSDQRLEAEAAAIETSAPKPRMPKSNKQSMGRLRRAITAQLKHIGYIDLSGLRVRTAHEVAKVAQVFRNPFYETFRIVYTTQEGNIVAHEAFTSKEVGWSGTSLLEGVAKARKQGMPITRLMERNAARLQKRIARLQKKHGRLNIWLLHNHPSGNPTPSADDINLGFAKDLQAIAGENGDYRGHVIIDSDQFGFVAPDAEDGRGDRYRLTSGQLTDMQPALPPELDATQVYDRPATDPSSLAAVGAAFKSSGRFVSLIYRTSQGYISAVEEVPVGLFQSQGFPGYVKNRRLEHGARDVTAYYGGEDLSRNDFRNRAHSLVADGVVLDGIYGGKSGWMESAYLRGARPSAVAADVSVERTLEEKPEYGADGVAEEEAEYPQAASGLADLGGAGKAIAANLHEMLWREVVAGETTEGGQPSKFLKLAKIEREAGRLQTQEEFMDFARKYSGAPAPETTTPSDYGEPPPLDSPEFDAWFDRLVEGELASANADAQRAIPESAVQPEPGTKPRKTAESLEKVGLPPGDSPRYTPISNRETEAAAKTRIKRDGLDGAERYVMEAEKPSAEHTATAVGVIAGYQADSERLRGLSEKAATVEEKEALSSQADERLQRAVSVATNITQRLTEAGQATQAAAIIGRLHPDGVILWAQRKVNQINKERPTLSKEPPKVLTPEEVTKLRKLATDAQEWEEVSGTARQMAEITDKIHKGEKLTDEDVTALKEFHGKIKGIVGETTPRPKRKPSERAELLIKRLDTMEQAAKERLRAKGVRIQSGIPLDMMADYAIIGAAKMAKSGVKFADWSTAMVADFGEDIRPHLRRIYGRSRETYRQENSRVRKVAAQARAINDLLEKVEGGEAIEVSDDVAPILGAAVDRLKTLSGEAQLEAAQEVQQIIALMDEPSTLRKVSAAQTTAMLLNPKTNVRNILGNELFWRTERVAVHVATPIDIARSQITGGDRQVTFRTGNQGGYWSGFFHGARLAWKGIAPGGLATQYDLGQAQGPAFRGKYNPMTYLEKAMGATLRGFDYAAYNRAYLARLGMHAELAADKRGLKGKDKRQAFINNFVANADENLREQASEYGKYVTFQDDNFISRTAVEAKRMMNFHKDFGVGDVILKFPKTPSNLFARALDYSPAGFARSAYIATAPYYTSKPVDVLEATMALSRAITGTGITAFGVYLFAKGVITAGDDDDYDARSFLREQIGQSRYQVNLSALGRYAMSFKDSALNKQKGDLLYSYDWAQPIAISFGAGANMARRMDEATIGRNAWDAFAGASIGAVETLQEQPLLQGLTSLFRGYGDDSLVRNLSYVAEGIPASFVPTFFNQVRQYHDNTGRELHDPTFFQRAINKALYKIPFVSEKLPVAYKTVGVDLPKEVYNDGGNTLFNVFLNPGFVARYKVDPDVVAFIEPYEEYGETIQFPRVAPRKLQISTKDMNVAGLGRKFNGPVTFSLTGEDRQKIQRHMAASLVMRMKKNNARLASATPDQQIKMVTDALNDGAADARIWFARNLAGKYLNLGDAKEDVKPYAPGVTPARASTAAQVTR